VPQLVEDDEAVESNSPSGTAESQPVKNAEPAPSNKATSLTSGCKQAHEGVAGGTLVELEDNDCHQHDECE
jgi:hypothetical protein